MKMRARFWVIPVILILLIPRIPAGAQTKKSTPANVKFGTLVSLDSEAATLILKPKTGADISNRLTEKTNILRAKKKVEASEFKPNDSIVVRFRKSSLGPASLYDLADKPSPANRARMAGAIMYAIAIRARLGIDAGELRAFAASMVPTICGPPTSRKD